MQKKRIAIGNPLKYVIRIHTNVSVQMILLYMLLSLLEIYEIGGLWNPLENWDYLW